MKARSTTEDKPSYKKREKKYKLHTVYILQASVTQCSVIITTENHWLQKKCQTHSVLSDKMLDISSFLHIVSNIAYVYTCVLSPNVGELHKTSTFVQLLIPRSSLIWESMGIDSLLEPASSGHSKNGS